MKKGIIIILIVEAILALGFWALVKFDAIEGQFCVAIMNEHTYVWPNWRYFCIT